jgi:hypothetical protein
MARPQKADRASVAGETLTIRITAAERVALDALCKYRQAEVEGTGATVTIAGVVRALIAREARAVLGTVAAPGAKPSAPEPARARQHRIAEQEPERDVSEAPSSLQNRIALAVKRGITVAHLAKRVGVARGAIEDPSQMKADKRAKLSDVLDQEGIGR